MDHIGLGDGIWQVAPDVRIEGLVVDYRSACAESDRIVSAMTLDAQVPHPRLGAVSVRWVLAHMVRETARHAGHADILRELTDGATGLDG